MREKITFITILLVTIKVLIGQNPKQESVTYYAWNYPEVKTTSNKIGFAVDEKSLPISGTTFYKNGDTSNFFKSSKGKIVIPSSFVNDLDLWSYETVPFDKADVKVFLTPMGTIYKVIGYENKRASSSEVAEYEGQLKVQKRLKIEIKDAQNNLLHEKIIEDVQELHNIIAFENKAISTERKAISLIKAQFLENKINYLAEANGILSEPLKYKALEYLQDVIDLRRKKQKLYLYSYKNKKGYDFTSIQNSIEDVTDLSEITLGDSYQSELEQSLLPNIQLWRNELVKYDGQDKKERKIIWGLLANISGAYYALGDNEKALAVNQEIEQIDYKNNYTYLKEFPTDQMASKLNYFGPDVEHNDYIGANFKGTHNPSYVYYQNTDVNELGANDAVDSDVSLKKREGRAGILSQILGQYEYLGELKRLSKKYNNRGELDVGFEETDVYFVEVFNRVVKESKSLNFLDLSVLDEQEKVVVAKVTSDLFKFYENYDKEISLENAAAPYNDVTKMSFDMQMVFLTKLFFSEKHEKRELDANIDKLANLMLIENNEIIRQLPFLEILLDELSTEGKLSYTDKPKLYKQLFKRYEKTYVTLFVDKTSIKQHLHHSALSSVQEELNDYYEFYRADLDEIKSKYENLHDNDRVVKILATFLK